MPARKPPTPEHPPGRYTTWYYGPMVTCRDCGSPVTDRTAHDKFHLLLERKRTVAAMHETLVVLFGEGRKR